MNNRNGVAAHQALALGRIALYGWPRSIIAAQI